MTEKVVTYIILGAKSVSTLSSDIADGDYLKSLVIGFNMRVLRVLASSKTEELKQSDDDDLILIWKEVDQH